MKVRILAVLAVTLFVSPLVGSQGQGRGGGGAGAGGGQESVLRPARVFDGEAMHEGWVVVVRGQRIEAAGAAASVTTPAGARVIDLPDTTLMPGMIEAHSHILLHAYNETPWNDQVLKEPEALRVARAVNHLRATLEAGYTTIRDLGTEGAGYADVGLKQAVREGIIPGPRMLVVTRAIVATGTYAPKGFSTEWTIPQGAEEADAQSLVRVVRDQAGHGADWIKVYGDYRIRPERRNVADVFAGRNESHRPDGVQHRPSGRRARVNGGRHAPCGDGGRTDDRARRQRDG